MRFEVRHVTEVRYASIVQLARFNLRLRPARWPGQDVFDYRLVVEPHPATWVNEIGPYVVNTTRLSIDVPISQLRIESHFLVDKQTVAPPESQSAPSVGDLRAAALGSRDLSEYSPVSYLFPTTMIPIEPEIDEWASSFLRDEDNIVSAASSLMMAINSQFEFDSHATETQTAPIEAFGKRRGVCQDFAQIMIAALRGAGIPAAYVSGYLRTIPPTGSPRLIGADATHAWVNVWCGEELGWIGFDPTNNTTAQDNHIFTAMGRDYGDVSPMDGVFLGSSGQQMRVSVDVTPK